MTLQENINLSLRAIRGNMLRSVLTMCIIALGLMALIGILTAIDALKSSINNNFASMGSNSFTIRNGSGDAMGEGPGEQKDLKPLSFNQATRFKAEYDYPGSLVSISNIVINQYGTIKHADKKTNPNVSVFAIDDNYLTIGAYEISDGRGFSGVEIASASRVAIVGHDVYEKLFGANTNPLGLGITINNQYFKVIGVLQSKGSSFMSSDNMVMIPVNTARTIFPQPYDQENFAISVSVRTPEDLDPATGDATGLMRQIRLLAIGDKNNFSITKSDSMVNALIKNLASVTIGAVIIGLITILGAAIGLVNIMLVQVNERTREIGISMAMGATRKIIRRQFLTEAIVICILGGLVGILLGILIGNGVASLFHVQFFIPWIWVGFGIVLCFITGIAAGYLPAIKASRLDPIEALRYE